MRIKKKVPPRAFEVGQGRKIKMHDCGSVYLNANEQLTFITKSGKQYDVASKSWGFYATPSMNGRLKAQGFKTALVKNKLNRYFVMIVDKSKMAQFKRYLKVEKNKVVRWLDEL